MNYVSLNTYKRGLRVILYYFMKLGYVEEFKITIHKAEKKIKEIYTDTELEILLKKPNLKHIVHKIFEWNMLYSICAEIALKTITNFEIYDKDIKDIKTDDGIRKNINNTIQGYISRYPV